MTVRIFDLNIKHFLENWDVEHALREIIANSLDEQVLSNSKEINIWKDNRGDWHIRDYGRGLRIEHFTLNENREKLIAPSGIIGKFGVGLKDALATFSRRGVKLMIASSFGKYRIREDRKHGFNNIITLHVVYDDTPVNLRGTECILRGISDADMEKAKSQFLKFSGEEVLESTAYGDVLRPKGTTSRVYIHGVLASEEPNFLFSYNVTNLTNSMRKMLNRERLNVGRTTYADRIRTILKSVKNDTIHSMLVEQIEKRGSGEQCDEIAWIEISQMVLTLMHQKKRVAYLTEKELKSSRNILDCVESDGFEVVVVTEQQKARLQTQMSTSGPKVRMLETYVEEYNSSFQYKFVGLDQLTSQERQVFDMTPRILALVGLSLSSLPAILISETMRETSDDTQGVWDSALPAIVIKRSNLTSLMRFASTLLHEVAHAATGTVDATRAFEAVLTDYLGQTAVAALSR